jgi:hypothetical protein
VTRGDPQAGEVTRTNYSGDAFVLSAAQAMSMIARLLIVCALAAAGCCLAGSGARWACVRARAARRRRRDQAALSAEVALGLAQVDEFLRAAASALGESADKEPDASTGQEPNRYGGNGTKGSDGCDG